MKKELSDGYAETEESLWDAIPKTETQDIQQDKSQDTHKDKHQDKSQLLKFLLLYKEEP